MRALRPTSPMRLPPCERAIRRHSGKVQLAAAQSAIATDWTTAVAKLDLT
ncbi:hypothetical protein ACIQ9Q_41575 [Streptomyces sp. NPDC094438]